MRVIRKIEDANIDNVHLYFGSRYNIIQIGRFTIGNLKTAEIKSFHYLRDIASAHPVAQFTLKSENADIFNLTRDDQKELGIAYSKIEMLEWLLEKSSNEFDLILEFDLLSEAMLFVLAIAVEPHPTEDIDLLELTRDPQKYEAVIANLLGQLDHFQEVLDSINLV